MVIALRPTVHSWTWSAWRSVILYGVAVAGMNAFFYHALARIPLGLAVAIEFAGPLMLSIALSRRRIDLLWSALAATGLAILGVEALWGSDAVDPMGILFAFIAGLFWAAYILCSARVGEEIDGASGLAMGLLIAALVALPVGASEASKAFSNPYLIFAGVLTGILSTLAPAVLEFMALRRVPRNIFSILLSLEPAIAALGGWLLLQQETGPVRWCAIALLICASIGITRTKPLEVSVATTELELLGYDESTATGALPTLVGFQTPVDLEDPEHPSPLTQSIRKIELPDDYRSGS